MATPKPRMNRLMSFERRDTDVGVTGQPVDTWKVFKQAWASLAPVSAREFFASSGQRATVTHKIQMRYGSVTVRPSDRARLGDRVFDIVSIVNENERNQTHTLMVIEQAS